MCCISCCMVSFQSTLPIQGETVQPEASIRVNRHFNPLSLYRERLAVFVISSFVTAFQSTLPIQGETNQRSIPHPCGGISIHSPYTGRDCIPYDSKIVSNISIHSPYTGRDERKGDPADPGNISIHSPYTGRDGEGQMFRIYDREISIHSPYTGRDRNEQW